MLKFSGWSCLISGQKECGVRQGRKPPPRTVFPDLAALDRSHTRTHVDETTAACGPVGPPTKLAPRQAGGGDGQQALCFSRPGPCVSRSRDGHVRPDRPALLSEDGNRGGARGELTLRQAYFRPRSRVQYAFKDSMIHGILQFTLRIAFRCVLHRCGSQDIRC